LADAIGARPTINPVLTVCLSVFLDLF